MVRIPINPIRIKKDPDFNRVTKNLARKTFPCGSELMALMDCLNKFSTDSNTADTNCARLRYALSVCTQEAGKVKTAVPEEQLQGYIAEVSSKWKLYGFDRFDKVGK